MIKTRVIPCLDVKDGRVVKGVNFIDLVDAGDPVEAAKAYDAAGADELCFLDITATHENRRSVFDIIKKTAEVCFMPLTVGGGVSSLNDIRDLMLAGADKVSINSAAAREPSLVSQASERFGSQAIVVAVDVKRVTRPNGTVNFEVCTHGGRRLTGLDALDYIPDIVRRGAGEILLTSMDADGTKSGFDIELCKAITDRVGVPVIASGGAGALSHFPDAVIMGGVDAVLAASVFHFGLFNIIDVKQAMHDAGLNVRRPDVNVF